MYTEYVHTKYVQYAYIPWSCTESWVMWRVMAGGAVVQRNVLMVVRVHAVQLCTEERR